MTTFDVQQQVTALAKKYAAGQATAAEIRILEVYYAAFDLPEPAQLPEQESLETIGRDMKTIIQQRIQGPKLVPFRRRMLRRFVAAAILLLLATGAYLWMNRQGRLPAALTGDKNGSTAGNVYSAPDPAGWQYGRVASP